MTQECALVNSLPLLVPVKKVDELDNSGPTGNVCATLLLPVFNLEKKKITKTLVKTKIAEMLLTGKRVRINFIYNNFNF